MQVSRRTIGLSIVAFGSAPLRHAQAIIHGGGGWCGGWDDGEWPLSVMPTVGRIAAERIVRLDDGIHRGATLDQLRAHHERIFPQVVEQGFARMSASRMRRYFQLASDRELLQLAVLYNRDLDRASRTGRLLPLMAARADDAAVLRATRAFGTAPVYEAVARHAPHRLPLMERAFSAGINAVPDPSQAFTPNLDMTILRIYQGFRTAPIGASSVAASLYQTGAFAGTHLVAAYGLGYGFGTAVVLPLVQTFLPSLYDTLGSTINSVLQGLSGLTGIPISSAQESATNDFQVSGLASVFEQTGGDYGAVNEWSISAGYSGSGC